MSITVAPLHCPGLQANKNLASFTCKCPNCGNEREIFSDEFERPQICKGCGQAMELSKCELEAGSFQLK